MNSKEVMDCLLGNKPIEAEGDHLIQPIMVYFKEVIDSASKLFAEQQKGYSPAAGINAVWKFCSEPRTAKGSAISQAGNAGYQFGYFSTRGDCEPKNRVSQCARQDK